MANPQKENGYIPIATEIVEKLIRSQISGHEYRILWIIIRKTWGWGKKDDDISLSQMAKMSDLNRRRICESLRNLVDRKIISSAKNRTGQSNSYRFNKDYEQWLPSAEKRTPSAEKRTRGSAEKRNRVVRKTAHTIDTITIDRVIDNTAKAEQSSAGKDISDVIYAFREVNPSYGKWYKNTTQRGAVDRMLLVHGKEELLKVISFLQHSNKMPFIQIATTPVQLEDKWAAIRSGLIKKKIELQEKNKSRIII